MTTEVDDLTTNHSDAEFDGPYREEAEEFLAEFGKDATYDQLRAWVESQSKHQHQ